MDNAGLGTIGQVSVHTTEGRGATPEELADRAMARLIFVSENAPPVIREQALKYQDNIRMVLVFYLREAVKADRRTLAQKFIAAGHPELVSLLDC